VEKVKPKVSVLLSAYNHQNYIQQCVESVLNQSYGRENIQFMAVDDCSKDQTGATLKKLSEQYGFEFVQNTMNQGLVINRNRMLSKANGKYICGIGSDDYWHPERLEKQVSFMESHPQYGMCYSRAYFIKEGEILENRDIQYKSGRIFGDLLTMKFHMPASTYMMRAEVFNHVGYYDENLKIEDWYMNLKIARQFEIGFLDDHLSFYRIHETNVSRNYDLLFDNQWKILQMYREEPLYKKAAQRYYLRKFYLFSSFKKKEAWKLVAKVLPNFTDKRLYKGLINLLFMKQSTARIYNA